jgi:hypothetical protein
VKILLLFLLIGIICWVAYAAGPRGEPLTGDGRKQV